METNYRYRKVSKETTAYIVSFEMLLHFSLPRSRFVLSRKRCVTDKEDYNLGQNKMKRQTPIPPKSRMKLREGQKRAIFPSHSRFSIYFVQDCRYVQDLLTTMIFYSYLTR